MVCFTIIHTPSSYARPADGHAHHLGHVHATPPSLEKLSESTTDLYMEQVDYEEPGPEHSHARRETEFVIPQFTGVWRVLGYPSPFWDD